MRIFLFFLRYIAPSILLSMAMFKKNFFLFVLGELMVKKEDDLKKLILKLLKDSEQPLSTQDISLKLKKPWHSIQTRCLMLQIENLINGFRVGRINLWQIK